MKLKVQRTNLEPTYTIGKFFINDILECNTLEDTVRDLNKDGDLDDAGETKIYGKTAIPYGTYKVILSYSNRFKRVLPELLHVKGFEGIRIHPGNTDVDTYGCILLGINNVKGMITSSKTTFDKFFAKIEKAFNAKEEITIEII